VLLRGDKSRLSQFLRQRCYNQEYACSLKQRADGGVTAIVTQPERLSPRSQPSVRSTGQRELPNPEPGGRPLL